MKQAMVNNYSDLDDMPKPNKKSFFGEFKKQWQSQAMVIPGIIFLIIFSYIPLYGIIAAFKDYDLNLGFFGSPWAVNSAGEIDIFKHFKRFMEDRLFWQAVKNTLIINLLGLLITFPAPIFFSLLLSEIQNKGYKKTIQTVTYMPYFISWIVFGGLIMKLLDPATGALGQLFVALGWTEKGDSLLSSPDYIYAITIISRLIKDVGWGSIIYLAALTSIADELIEAADLEGANRFQKMKYISLPTIQGTVALYFIFAVSGMLGSNFDQMYILQNNFNKATSDVIDTYVYNIGIRGGDWSYSTALGLARSVIAFALLIMANFFSKKISGNGLY